ncbi:hypothetical protein A7K94_0203120 [Modestobacter sp. VKM Ac-2676]|nr:hypothetical protein A7K94_0203120 [Modestobacter sp. VKM Ac-2676]
MLLAVEQPPAGATRWKRRFSGTPLPVTVTACGWCRAVPLTGVVERRETSGMVLRRKRCWRCSGP